MIVNSILTVCRREEMSYSMKLNHFYQGDALEVLKTFPDESIDCCASSPPYWALRDYKCEGQLGLEPTAAEYIEKLCAIYDEVYRVLKKTGTCWVNLGDTYAGGGQGPTGKNGIGNHSERQGYTRGIDKNHMNIKPKSLCLIPSRFAIAMIDRGWILRNELIWHKPNCMPSSVKDRFTIDFETIFFFSKSQKYYFETQYEELSESYLNDKRPMGVLRQKVNKNSKYPDEGQYKKQDALGKATYIGFNAQYSPPLFGRNKRTVWTIPTSSYSQAHFATFPEALIQIPIQAGCPEEVCSKCRKPREPIFEPSPEYDALLGKSWTEDTDEDQTLRAEIGFQARTKTASVTADYIKTGLTDCGCGAPFSAGIVLDPFMGAGTTALTALKLGRSFVGIELNPKYVQMAEDRLREEAGLLWYAVKQKKDEVI